MAVEDESPPELTLPDMSNQFASSGTYPLQEIVTHNRSTPTRHIVASSSLGEATQSMEPLYEIGVPEDETCERRPRHLSGTVYRALPFLLSALVVYIYYVYAVLVCSKALNSPH